MFDEYRHASSNYGPLLLNILPEPPVQYAKVNITCHTICQVKMILHHMDLPIPKSSSRYIKPNWIDILIYKTKRCTRHIQQIKYLISPIGSIKDFALWHFMTDFLTVACSSVAPIKINCFEHYMKTFAH